MALTPNGLSRIVHDGLDHTAFNPVVQVTDIKNMSQNRYRLMLSDGTNSQQAVLATQKSSMVESGTLQLNCLAKLLNYNYNKTSGKGMLVLLDLEIKQGPCSLIGEPVQLGQDPPRGSTQVPSQAPGVPYKGSNPYSKPEPNTHNPYNTANRGAGGAGGRGPVSTYGGQGGYQPISSLNPYQNRWVIKARVTNKTPIKTWSNVRGEGKLASIELLDDQGTEIRGTFFKQQVDDWYNRIEQGKVYSISGGRIKIANKQYSNVKNDYEITFDNSTDIQQLDDDSSIEGLKLSIVKIQELSSLAPNTNVDILAVVKNVGEMAEIVSQKQGGRQLQKRDLILVDDSGAEVKLTVWNEMAKDGSMWVGNPTLVGAKNVRVSDFGGVTLSANQSSGLNINPDIPEAHSLHSWWMSGGSEAQSTSLSTGGGGGRDKPDQRKTIAAIKDEQLGFKEKPDWLSLKATVCFIKHDKEPWYPACNSGNDCKKKASEDLTGVWRCDTCDKTFERPIYRYIMSTKLVDHTGQNWFSAFNETAETMLGGQTANELKQMLESGQDNNYEDAFSEANFKPYIVTCRVKSEQVNDETRVKSTLVRLTPVDFVEESKNLLGMIAKYDSVQ